MSWRFLAVLALLLSLVSAAHAAPVFYQLNNTSAFSVGGVDYPQSHTTGNSADLRFYFVGDSSASKTTYYQDPVFGTVPLQMTTPINAAVLGYRNTTLATLADALEIIYQFAHSEASIFDLTTGEDLLFPVVARTQDGGVTFAANNSLTSLYLGAISPIGTSIGPLTITSGTSKGPSRPGWTPQGFRHLLPTHRIPFPSPPLSLSWPPERLRSSVGSFADPSAHRFTSPGTEQRASWLPLVRSPQLLPQTSATAAATIAT